MMAACNVSASGNDFCRLGNELGNGYFIAAGNTTIPYSYYPYEPSVGGNIAFAVVFAISTGLHFWQLIRKKAWYMVPLAIGANMEMLGYFGRFLNGRQDPWEWTKMWYYLAEFTLILAPALYMITLILIFKLCVTIADGDHVLILGTRINTILTGILTIISTATVIAGTALLVTASTPDKVETARKISLGGMALLLIAGNIILILGGLWVFKMKKNPSSRSLALPPCVLWHKMAAVAVFCTMLVLIRCGFRSALFLQLKNVGFLAKREAIFLGAEGGMLAQVSCILNWFHPTRILNVDMIEELHMARAGDPYSQDTELGTVQSLSYEHQVPKRPGS